MQVVHIQTGMPPAGNAAYRLHKAMEKIGIKSSIITYLPSPYKHHVTPLPRTICLYIKTGINRIYQLFCGNIKKYKKPGSYFYSQPPVLSKNITNLSAIKEADAIYIHSINGGFLGISDFEELAKTGKPIIFFMHDMWTFTGGCHHSFNCEQYKTGCKNCGMFKTNCSFAKKQNKAKEDIFKKYDNFYFISPSEWMYKCAKESNILKNKPVYTIPNVVDEKIFKPIDKNVARNILNLPKDKKIIAFGCQAGTNNKFKGWEYLRDAINTLNVDGIELLLYGSEYNKQTKEELKFPIHFIGPVFDETKLALICNASDIFVSPSLAESFGLTLLENSLCGTPVVAFDCTAVPEIVNLNPNGYLATYKSATSLAEGIGTLLTKETKKTSIEYSSSNIAQQHKNLISSLKNY